MGQLMFREERVDCVQKLFFLLFGIVGSEQRYIIKEIRYKRIILDNFLILLACLICHKIALLIFIPRILLSRFRYILIFHEPTPLYIFPLIIVIAVGQYIISIDRWEGVCGLVKIEQG